MKNGRFIALFTAIFAFFILIFVISSFVLTREETPKNQQESAKTGTAPFEEKQQIERWIEENGLNEYGDSKGTVYAGGTPLFNEKTGKSIDRYEYVLRKHPDKPWEESAN